MGDSVFVLLDAVRRRVGDFLVAFDFDNLNGVGLFDEKVGAELATLGVLAFLPGVLDGVEANICVLKPSVDLHRILARDKLPDEFAFWLRVGDDEIGRSLEIGGVGYRESARNVLPVII